MQEQNICFSGGAIGADSEWSQAASYFNHDVEHYSFDGHKICSKAVGNVITLTELDLKFATPNVRQAALFLRKNPPYKPFTKNLIHRNFYQIYDTEAVYAVGGIIDGFVQGGTAWAVYMYILTIPKFKKHVYFFDQGTEKWYEYTSNPYPWFEIEKPPKPNGKWTGIGTRNLTNAGKSAIWSVFKD